MWTAAMLKDMLTGLEAMGMDLSIMEIRVKSSVGGLVHVINGMVDVEVNPEGTYGNFAFVYQV
jgi:hypothetical protein